MSGWSTHPVLAPKQDHIKFKNCGLLKKKKKSHYHLFQCCVLLELKTLPDVQPSASQVTYALPSQSTLAISL